MTISFNHLPELKELFVVYEAIVININCVEELNGRDPAKLILPVFDRFRLVDLIAAIHIEDTKDSPALLFCLRS